MPDDAIADLYRRSIIIDSLNISNWHSDNVFADLYDGGLTATSATAATWEGFVETADAVAAWYERFRARSAQIRPVRSVADIHAANAAGNTALHSAAASAFYSVVEYLVGRGAGLDLENADGRTPLAMTTTRWRRGGRDPERTAELLRRLGATE